MDPTTTTTTTTTTLDARRLLEIAEKLLDARDLIGSKRFAERALESDPLLDNVDQTLAIADVLLASQRRINNHIDSYSILQLPHPSFNSPSSSNEENSLAIKRSYRRLALLLSPDRNRSPLASPALRSLSEAYAILSDPTKKSLLDSEIRSNNNSPAPRPAKTFWTSCPSCVHVFEYDRFYVDRSLRCRTCRQPFQATEMAAKPPLVPGTDMYYCAWGFFPLGIRDGLGEGWKPFVPVSPVWGGKMERPLNAVPVNFADGKKGEGGRSRKAVAKKRAGGKRKKKCFSVASEDGGGVSNFDIDLDAAEDVLGNLPNLPFL